MLAHLKSDKDNLQLPSINESPPPIRRERRLCRRLLQIAGDEVE
jgi:hypothetical protein